MILKELTIRGFGKFHDRTVVFSDGVNIIYGGNEAGKSTLHAFLTAMLYGLPRAKGRASKTDAFMRHQPWFGDGAYGGSLRVSFGDREYRIERNFLKSATDLTIVDLKEGVFREEPEALLREMLGGLTETAFHNTVSIGQLKSATDAGMVDELKNYIANLNTTGNMALNITKAAAFLRDQRNSFSRQLIPDAAKDYAARISEIRRTEEELKDPRFRNRMKELKEAQNETEAARQGIQTAREQLLQKSAADRQTLNARDFTNREEIRLFEAKADREHMYLKESIKNASSRSYFAGAVLLLLLGVLSLGAFFWLSGGSGAQHLFTPAVVPISAITALLGVACLIFALLLYRRHAANRKELERAKETFCDCIREHFPELVPEDKGVSGIDHEAVFARTKEETEKLAGLCDSLDAGTQGLAECDSRLIRLLTHRSKTEEEIVEQQKSQWVLEQKLVRLSELKEEAGHLAGTVAENERLQTEIDAIDIALDTMQEISLTFRDSFGLYLNKRASDLIRGITGGIYDSLSIDQNLNVFLNTEQKLIPLDQVSSGTMDQVYLALRLAAGEFMAGEKELPFLFDDSFVNYDERRLASTMQWLGETFPTRQMIIFSCHRREAQILSAEQKNYRLVKL